MLVEENIMNEHKHGVTEYRKINFPKEDNVNPHVMAVCLGGKEISSLVKSLLSEEDKELFKGKMFYPIRIRQNDDLSYDIIFGIMV